jgi:Asp-tRNA(Asn)/Glu-tRNA(Gln) amidotransferase A subunit family amidase
MTVVGEHAMESASSIAVGVVAGASAREVLAEHVRRHAETHPRLNALVLPRHEHAAVEAAGIDAGDRRGLTLAGVPVSVKECFAVTGLPTTLGIRKRRGIIDTSDCAVVSRLRQAGAVIVGKANVPQAMYLHETDNPVHGRTNHPDRGDRGPGGSSGGDAALVAAGVVPLAVGNDLAGSIRQPAHACGVYGFLPRSVALGEGGAFDNLPGLQLVRPGFSPGVWPTSGSSPGHCSGSRRRSAVPVRCGSAGGTTPAHWRPRQRCDAAWQPRWPAWWPGEPSSSVSTGVWPPRPLGFISP